VRPAGYANVSSPSTSPVTTGSTPASNSATHIATPSRKYAIPSRTPAERASSTTSITPNATASHRDETFVL